MGQRFQVYVEVFGDRQGRDEEPKKVMLGYHLQWSWGHYSLIRAHQLLNFLSKDNQQHYPVFKDNVAGNLNARSEIVKGLIQMNLELGSFVNAWELSDDETFNPSHADNNDGALYINTTGEEIKYCFFDPYKPTKAQNAGEYAKRYMDYLQEDAEDSHNQQELLLYAKYLAQLQDYPVHTLEELRKAFPAMFTTIV